MRCIVLTLTMLFLGILPVAAQDTGNADYFAQASVDNPTPFVGQQITYIFRLYDAVGLNSPLYEPSDFEGFWRIDLGSVSQHSEQLNNRQYNVSEIKTALYPTRAGDIPIAPAGVVLPETVFQSKRELKADSVVVQVQPLPAGAPEGFSGAVGQFQMSATLDRQSIKLGEPVTLHLTVTGTGNVEQLPLPSVTLPSNWRGYENPAAYNAALQNNQVVGIKVFELLFFPDQIGTPWLPAVTLSYFDPASLSYRSVTTSPVQIEVLPSGNQDSAPAVSIYTTPVPSVIDLMPVLLQHGAANPDLGFWLIWLLPPLIVASIWGWRWNQRRILRDRLKTHHSQALKRAFQRLDASRKRSSREACHQVKDTMIEYIVDKLGLPPENKAQLDWQREIEKQNLQISRQLQTAIELADQGLYAPASQVDVKALVERVAKILADVDRTWKSS